MNKTYNPNAWTVTLGIGTASLGLISAPNYGVSSFEQASSISYYSSSLSTRYEASPVSLIDSKVKQFFEFYPEVRDALNKLGDITARTFAEFESSFEVVTDWDTGKDILAWHISTGFDAVDILAEKERIFFDFIDQEKLADQLLDVVVYIS
jgi:hypothetical protein